MEIDKVEQAVEEMKKLKEEYLKRNGESALRISNKEFNLWIVNKLQDQDGRICRLEGTVKLLGAFITGAFLLFIGGTI